MSPAADYMVPVVLLVDHELSVRRAAAEEMEVAGLHVLEAANADEALRLRYERSDDAQVLVTDVDMRSATSGLGLAVQTTPCRARSPYVSLLKRKTPGRLRRCPRSPPRDDLARRIALEALRARIPTPGSPMRVKQVRWPSGRRSIQRLAVRW